MISGHDTTPVECRSAPFFYFERHGAEEVRRQTYENLLRTRLLFFLCLFRQPACLSFPHPTKTHTAQHNMEYEEESNSLEMEESSLDITPAEGVARPPSGTNLALLKSYTYATSLPTALEKDQECILGVDEAGRGPVLGTFICLEAECIIKNKDPKGYCANDTLRSAIDPGPMVYGICYCPLAKKDELADLGFAGERFFWNRAVLCGILWELLVDQCFRLC